jgi:hypothetical protein
MTKIKQFWARFDAYTLDTFNPPATRWAGRR